MKLRIDVQCLESAALARNDPKTERIKDLPRLKAEIISYLFDHVARKLRDRWYKYKGEFHYDGKTYDLECECKWDNQMFTYRHMHISHKQVELDVNDVLEMDLSKLMH